MRKDAFFAWKETFTYFMSLNGQVLVLPRSECTETVTALLLYTITLLLGLKANAIINFIMACHIVYGTPYCNDAKVNK